MSPAVLLWYWAHLNNNLAGTFYCVIFTEFGFQDAFGSSVGSCWIIDTAAEVKKIENNTFGKVSTVSDQWNLSQDRKNLSKNSKTRNNDTIHV